MYQNVVLEERTVKVLALLGVLAFVGMALMPVSFGDLALYLANQGNGAGAGGSAIVSAGLIRVSPEVAMFLVDAGMVSSATGVGIVVGGFAIGIGFAL